MIQLQVPGLLMYRDVALRVVASACRLAAVLRGEGTGRRIGAEFTEQVVSAVGEAFNNIVLHAYRERQPEGISVEVEIAADRLLIRLLDQGASFDPTEIPRPPLEALPESGMGLYIIHAFMDEVTYTPGSPNILMLTKYF